MMMHRRRSVVFALFGLLTSAVVATPASAEVGAVRVVFTKGGFIVGVGGGEGVLTFRGKNYPFTVSGSQHRLHRWRVDHQAGRQGLEPEKPR